MPRLFIAIDLPDAHKTKLASLRDDTIPGRWTPFQKFHLTLRFIGEVDENHAAAVEQALVGLQGEAFSLQGQGLDVFPSARRPRVLFARLDLTPALRALHTEVEQALCATGLDKETKPFHPHVTLARMRRADAPRIRTFLRMHEAFVFDPFEVNHYYLYESVLRREGALYTKRAAFPLRHS